MTAFPQQSFGVVLERVINNHGLFCRGRIVSRIALSAARHHHVVHLKRWSAYRGGLGLGV